jgi:hypothetical protein
LLAGELPGWFPWPLFVGGMALASLSAVASLRAGAETAQPSLDSSEGRIGAA